MISDYIKMQVELVPWGRGWLVFVLCVPSEDWDVGNLL